jgi:MOSC domain-containing protein YiiM
VFALAPDGVVPPGADPIATVREQEGLTLVLSREEADAAGLSYSSTLAWITLQVHSLLEDVGLTAAVSAQLTTAQISCNVVAGLHHDHIFVPSERGAQACELLAALQGAGGGRVVGVSMRSGHGIGKDAADRIRLVAGLGVEGDAHLGETIKHRSRVRRDPTEVNLRQVHLIHAELHDELAAAGFAGLRPGQMGENVTTSGLDLLALPAGARLRLGDEAVVQVTGLRNPCKQLDEVQPGLMQATLGRDADGGVVRKAGVMGIVLAGGDVRPGDAITVLPPPHRALRPV